MQKILLTLLIIFSFSYVSNAQFSKGSVLLGGDISWYSGKNSSTGVPDNKGNSGAFDISIGKAVKENSFVGMNLTYSHQEQGAGYKTNGYGIGFFYRVYKDLGKNFYVFGEAGAGYLGSTQTQTDNSNQQVYTVTNNSGRIYLIPGLSYKVSKKFLLELSIPSLFSLYYTSSKTVTKGTPELVSTSDAFNANVSLTSNPLTNLAIGFRLIL